MNFNVITCTVAVIGLTVLVSGCSTSTGDTTFEVAEAAAFQLIDELNTAGLTATMPTAGSATYNGYIAMSDDLDEGAAIGDLALTADFAAAPGAQITGSGTNFIDDTAEAMGGSVTISAGTISASAFTADVDGTLTQAGDTFLADGLIDGDFYGDSLAGQPQGVLGDITGDLTITEGAAAPVTVALEGLLVAEQ